MAKERPRIHVTGGPGSGKTRLAERLATARSVPLHDLDGLLLRAGDEPDPATLGGTISRLVRLPEWVSEGVYFDWARPFLDHADAIVWLDVASRVASYRVISRHVRLELARKNRFPGWRRLYRFWRWTVRFYADTNEQTINRWGAPNTRSVLEAQLSPYRDKLVICRTNADIEDACRKLGVAR
jgi:adenylate kinase family enzyme